MKRLKQLPIPTIEFKAKRKWQGEKVFSLQFSENQILRQIMVLYTGGERFDLDPTFSTGRIWKDLPHPKYISDLHPQVSPMICADAQKLPFKSESMRNIFFDPPFHCGTPELSGKIRARFSCFPDVSALWNFYWNSLQELHRVLKKDGVLVFKCQDTIEWTRQYLSHVFIIDAAERIGFYAIDLFVLGRYGNGVIWSPHMKQQFHARKNHCYFLVFQKTDDEKLRIPYEIRKEILWK